MAGKMGLARILRLIIMIAFIGLAGWGIMYSSVYLLPKSDSTLNYLFITIALIILGLLIPYIMLKFGAHAAHKRDPREKELRMEDIPKDYDQLKKEQ